MSIWEMCKYSKILHGIVSPINVVVENYIVILSCQDVVPIGSIYLECRRIKYFSQIWLQFSQKSNAWLGTCASS